MSRSLSRYAVEVDLVARTTVTIFVEARDDEDPADLTLDEKVRAINAADGTQWSWGVEHTRAKETL